MSCSHLLSSRSLLGLSPDPAFPEEGPHSLFLQEGHLQALQVQELPARVGKASSEQGGRRSHRRHQQGPLPLLLGQHQRWSSQPTQADRETPAPCSRSQESKSPWSQAPDPAQVDWGWGPGLCPEPQEAPCPLLPSRPGSSKVSSQHWVPV